jgi:hypothetical protein
MSTVKLSDRKKEPLPMSVATKRRLQNVSALFKGKEAFPEKIAQAKQLFKGLSFGAA